MWKIRFVITLCFLLFSLVPLHISAYPASASQTTTFVGSATAATQVTFAYATSTTYRLNPTATLLNDGRVLVAAGNLNAPFTADVYDPTTGYFSSAGTIPSGEGSYAATLLKNGKVLLAGGYYSDPSASLYDPVTGTWSVTGDMIVRRHQPTATLLNDGKVLVAGGRDPSGVLASAELYDPVSGTWSSTGSMNIQRRFAAAVLLNDGKVLVAGGVDATAELYDPATGIWSMTGSMRIKREQENAILLKNGKVLIAGGSTDNSAELYDPATGTWSQTGNILDSIIAVPAVLLSTGEVLLAGGDPISYSQLYNPLVGTWSTTGRMTKNRWYHSATVLKNGNVLVVGNINYDPTAEIGTVIPRNTFTGTLTLPTSWSNSSSITVQFFATTSDATSNAGSLSNNGSTWGDWIETTPGITTTTTWNAGSDGTNRPIYLRVRDINGQVATVVMGTVNVDATAPTGSIWIAGGANYAPSSSVGLTMSASDATSGVAQMSFSNDGTNWSSWEYYSTSKSWILAGGDGVKTVYVRYSDNAGNISAPISANITLDTLAPAGSVAINGGATYVNSTSVNLALDASDASSGVAQMSFSNDGTNWSSWEYYSTNKTCTIPTGDGSKTIYARFQDWAGNVSATTSASIILDTVAPTGILGIAGGASYSTSTSVNLTLSASDSVSGVWLMRFSNDGSNWSTPENFAVGKTWTLSSGDGAKTIYAQFADYAGNSSALILAFVTLDTTPPIGTVVIAGGATYVGSTNVILILSASDATSDVAQMSFSNDASTWSAWEGYSGSKAWTLSNGDGTKTVYARYKDNAGNMSNPVSDNIVLDSTPPTGAVMINNDATFANSLSTILTLNASDATSGIVSMAFSDDGASWYAWETYSTSRIWTLSIGDGTQAAYARFKDTIGNVSAVVSDTIILDTQPPSAAVNPLAPAQPTLSFTLSWSGTDVRSGIANYDIQFRDGINGSWANWQLATTSTSAIFTGQDGHTYSFRARARDNAGNVSLYSAGDTQTIVDLTLPVVTNIIINGGATNTSSTNVALSFSVTDPTSIVQASFSNDGTTWGDWISYAIVMDWSVTPGDGLKTVYGRVKNLAGNVSAVVSDTIILDSSVGTDYGLTINSGAIYTNQTTVTLTLGARVATSMMMVSNDGLFQGANWEPYASRRIWTLTEYKLGIPATRLVYIKYQALNGSISSQYNDEIILDVNPPTGSVVIVSSDNSAVRRPNATVTLSLSATDDVSGVATMMLSGRSDFASGNWQPFVTSTTLNLGNNNTVYVRFRDNAGNVSQTYSTSLSGGLGNIFLPFITR